MILKINAMSCIRDAFSFCSIMYSSARVVSSGFGMRFSMKVRNVVGFWFFCRRSVSGRIIEDLVGLKILINDVKRLTMFSLNWKTDANSIFWCRRGRDFMRVSLFSSASVVSYVLFTVSVKNVAKLWYFVIGEFVLGRNVGSIVIIVMYMCVVSAGINMLYMLSSDVRECIVSPM